MNKNEIIKLRVMQVDDKDVPAKYIEAFNSYLDKVVIPHFEKQLADTEAQNKRVLEKLELLVKDNQDLQQQLAEKDKEIKMLDLMIKTLPEHDKEMKQIIHHQICEEIRHRALLLYDNCPDHKNERMYGVRKCLLDKIENGE